MAKLSLLTAAALLLAAGQAVMAVPDIKDKYIIKLKANADQGKFTAQLQNTIHTENARPDKAVNHQLIHTYTIGDFKGYAGKFSAEAVQKLRKDPMVESITEDKIVHALGTEQNPPSWGLRRISERALDLSQPYTYPDTAGAGVTAYVIDTGMMITHPDIQGRATWGYTACSGCQSTDDNGHGTHVSTTIGGTTYGVAKKVSLVAVKVLGGDGSGSNSDVVAGINWVANQVKQNGGKKAVANMSLGGSFDQSTNDAVEAAIAAGVVFGVAAGNDNADACNGSPSSAPSAVCVGATDNTDTRASFSDFGSCVTVFAPGVDITAGWNDGNSQTISGTSMATPHVVGVAALYLGENGNLTPAQVKSLIQSSATKNVVKDPQNSANLLVFNVAGSGTNPNPPPPTKTPTHTPTHTPKPPPSCPWWAWWC
ncbi:hypothetical protein RI367_004621 [Sorochytrium milnesiophthora]